MCGHRRRAPAGASLVSPCGVDPRGPLVEGTRSVGARLRARLGAEGGFALILALACLVVLGASVSSVMLYTQSNYTAASGSNARQLALQAADSGLNTATAILIKTGGLTNQTTSVPLVANPEASYTYTGAFVDPIWTVTAIGKVTNAATGKVVATVTVSQKAKITQASAGGDQTTVWNFIYADSNTGCTTISSFALVNLPVFTNGDLCLSDYAAVGRNSAFSTAYPTIPQVQVGGKITIGGTHANVGSSGSPINIVQTGQGCNYSAALHNPCKAADRVYASAYQSTKPTITKPVINLPLWYGDAQPGPQHPCTSGTFPPGFESAGNTLQDASVGNVSLTPATAYDCKVTDSNGTLLGEIGWTPPPDQNHLGTLTVSGTIYIDGNLVWDQDANYVGRATLYMGGTVSFTGSLCAGNPSDCGSSWDTNQDLIVLVAGSNLQQPAGYAMKICCGAWFQGALEANGDFQEVAGVGVWGSIIAHQVTISSGAFDFYVPFGTAVPGQPSEGGYQTTLMIQKGSYTATG
jgi:Tfp pilus assembly protein PilX